MMCLPGCAESLSKGIQVRDTYMKGVHGLGTGNGYQVVMKKNNIKLFK